MPVDLQNGKWDSAHYTSLHKIMFCICIFKIQEKTN